MPNKGLNKVRGWVGDVPDIDDLPNTTSHIFSIRGETTMIRVIARNLELSNNCTRPRVLNYSH